MLDQRRRRWANIKPTVGQCLVFAGMKTNSAWLFHSFNMVELLSVSMLKMFSKVRKNNTRLDGSW